MTLQILCIFREDLFKFIIDVELLELIFKNLVKNSFKTKLVLLYPCLKHSGSK